MNGYANQYLTNAVRSASKEQLMLMLYDGAIRFLAQGIQAIEDHQLDKRAYYINKSSAIITEFASTLDYDQDAKLADDLKALYLYMLKRLMQGNKNNDTEPVKEVQHLLTDLRKTWSKAIEINKQDMQETTIGPPSSSSPQNEPYKSIATAM